MYDSKCIYKIIGYLLIAIFYSSCGPSEYQKEMQLESKLDSTASLQLDSIRTLEIPPTDGNPVPETNKEITTLCYSYFTSIAINETKDVNVLVSMDKETDIMIAQIQNIVEEQESKIVENIKNDSQSCIRIKYYKILTVELIDISDCFEIISNDSQTQYLDPTNDLNWRWTIKPKKDVDAKIARLVIRISGGGEDGKTRKIKEKDIRLDIKIPPNSYWRKMLVFLYNNPELLLTLLLIPLFKYLFGLIKSKNVE